MRDADAVGEFERPRAFEDDLDDPLDRQQSVWRAVILERSAVHVFHDDVAQVLGDDGVENLHDVRVRELADQRGFVEKEAGV